MASKKIQLYTDRDKTIEASPETSANCVILSDGNDLQKVLDNDLTTPTVVHEETNFKVGVGDVNVSSSVVDGEVGRMVIKGKTYQNILPEPSLRNSMTNGKSMQKLNEGYENVSVVDGVAKSAILKGVTGYKDVDTGEILETFEEGRNLELVSVKMPVLHTVGKNLWCYENNLVEFDIAYIKVSIPRGSYYFSGEPSKTYDKPVVVVLRDKTKQLIAYGYLGNCIKTDFDIDEVVIYSNGYSYANSINNFLSLKNFMMEKDTFTGIYEPHKSNILSALEPVELGSVGNVQDTLDLLTGDLTKRVYKIVFDESFKDREVLVEEFENVYRFGVNATHIRENLSNDYVMKSICDRFSLDTNYTGDYEHCYYWGATFYFFIAKSKLQGTSSSFKTYITDNPITFQTICAKKVNKTVDLSSFGNWEKVVLDGSDDEGWGKTESTNSNTKSLWFMPNTEQLKGGAIFCDKLPTTTSGDSIGVRNSKSGGIYIHIDKTETLGVREWVAKNSPLTIWYQTTTSQANSIKEMLSFSNGHIQLSSEEGSLIPSLDYEVPTSNSYHMDLMKEGTYTMKCESCNGSLNFLTQNLRMLGTNKTFEVQSVILREDKLVMLEGSWTNPMIIEGDVTSVTLPYFTGIKSSFEGESKIEVLSTGKNLFNMNRPYDNLSNKTATVVQNVDEITISSIENGTYVNVNFVLDKNFFKGKTVVGSCLYESDMKGIGTVQINYQDGNGKKYYHSLKYKESFTFPNDFTGDILLCVYANNTGTPQSNTVTVKNIQLELGTKSTTYDSHKSNVSKIPLLSPLRSLPNGVCDELIIDRMKKKATLIQRVGKAMFDGSDSEIWGFMDSPSDTTSYLYQCYVRNAKANSNDTSEHLLCKNILVRTANSNWNNKYESGIALNENKNIQLRCTKDESSFRSWLSQNPTTVYYELETPVITEVDLEGFPYIYKDGHIFLNSEIAPVVEIAYNVNQTQQIQANNETLQRHELDILDLDNLIVSFVNAEYNLRLLKFDMELSMMALAE